jgi:hypothetical protein
MKPNDLTDRLAQSLREIRKLLVYGVGPPWDRELSAAINADKVLADFDIAAARASSGESLALVVAHGGKELCDYELVPNDADAVNAATKALKERRTDQTTLTCYIVKGTP